MNPVLSFDDEEEFVRWFPTTFPGTPAYYARMRPLNQQGPRLRSEIAPPPELPAPDFESQISGAVIVDARQKEDYARGHIPGSFSIPFRDAFAVWLGWLAPASARLLLVADPREVDAIVDECLLVGYEDFAGWLSGGLATWARGRDIRSARLVEPGAARQALANGAASVDVREPDEFESGHVEGAISLPLGDLAGKVTSLPRDRQLVVYCAAGDRASSAASLLERAGFTDVLNLAGGADAWRDAGLPLLTSG